MSVPTFDYILNKIRPLIEKIETPMRETISAGARLEATLLYLITGDTYSRLQHLTRIHESTLGQFIPDVCEAIFKCLRDEFLLTPRTTEEWLRVAEDFNNRGIIRTA